MATPRFFSRASLAATLDCSLRHVDNLDAQGRLPKAIRLGRIKRWPAALIDAWISAGCPSRETFESMREGGEA